MKWHAFRYNFHNKVRVNAESDHVCCCCLKRKKESTILLILY